MSSVTISWGIVKVHLKLWQWSGHRSDHHDHGSDERFVGTSMSMAFGLLQRRVTRLFHIAGEAFAGICGALPATNLVGSYPYPATPVEDPMVLTVAC